MAEESNGSERWTLVGSVGAALTAAICCLGPVVLVSLGVTGAWIGKLSALEPYRPLFMLFAAGLLGLAFYRVYGGSERGATDPEDDCANGEACEVPGANRTNRVALWVATVAVAGLFASPYLLEASAGSNAEADSTADDSRAASSVAPGDAEKRVTLAVDGMTCGGCVATLTATLERIDGVEDAEVTLQPPRATVVYDQRRVTVRDIEDATEDVGYEATPRN